MTWMYGTNKGDYFTCVFAKVQNMTFKFKNTQNFFFRKIKDLQYNEKQFVY